MNIYKVTVKTLGETTYVLKSDLTLEDFQLQLKNSDCVVFDDMLITKDSLIKIEKVIKTIWQSN